MYFSPTYGQLTTQALKKKIANYMSKKDETYHIILGVDSQKNNTRTYDFVTALVIQRVGHGGIYFWKRKVIEKKIGLKQRMYMEAIMSLESAEDVIKLFKGTRISKFDIEIHVDIGRNGKTKELITEIIGMVHGSGYKVKVKPESFGASKVADRHA